VLQLRREAAPAHDADDVEAQVGGAGRPVLGMFLGGAGLAAATAALEVATGRPLVWASAQYLSYALPPSSLIPAPPGDRYTEMRPVSGRKPFAGFSVVTRH